MWYGYVGPGLRGVTQDIHLIRRLHRVYPYLKFRKRDTEEQAWEFVNRQGRRSPLSKLTKYGNIFDNHYVTIEYFITDDSIYYNIFTKKLGYIKVSNTNPNISVENRSEMIKIKYSNIFLNNQLISSHAIAIFHVLKILGSYVDCEIKVPDHSIFYLLSSYTGNKPNLLRVLKYIKSRKGKIAVTVKDEGWN